MFTPIVQSICAPYRNISDDLFAVLEHVGKGRADNRPAPTETVAVPVHDGRLLTVHAGDKGPCRIDARGVGRANSGHADFKLKAVEYCSS